MPDSTLETLCPMCGAKLGFSRQTCKECGESLVSTEELPVTYDDFLVYRARNSMQLTGVLFATLGFLLALSGGMNVGRTLLTSDIDGLPVAAAILAIGLCWLSGGGMIYRLQSLGYWFVQPINLTLLVTQWFWLEEFTVILYAVVVGLTILAQRCRRLIRVALNPYESVTK